MLVVRGAPNEDMMRASRNLAEVKVAAARGVNVYDMLSHKTLVITKDALDRRSSSAPRRAEWETA